MGGSSGIIALAMRKLQLLLISALVTVLPSIAAPGITGLWDAVVVVNQEQIPFRFEIEQKSNQVQGFSIIRLCRSEEGCGPHAPPFRDGNPISEIS